MTESELSLFKKIFSAELRWHVQRVGYMFWWLLNVELILPEVPLEEAEILRKEAKNNGIELVFF